MRVLFISRKYPPSVGGMETHALGLISTFAGEKKMIVLGRSQLHLVWFLPYALFKGFMLGRSVDLIHLCDGLLAPIGLLLKWGCRKPVTTTIHGLDLVYPNWIFQHINVACLRRLTHWMPVSQATFEEMGRRGFPAERTTMIPNGVDPDRLPSPLPKSVVEQWLQPDGRRVMVTVGRLVKRKGVAWFIMNVLSRLPSDVLYVVAGEGPDRRVIEQTILNRRIGHRVKMLGRISDKQLSGLFQFADVFVMPNVRVPGDREGFGLVPLEASIFGLPVVASRVDGIPDAIHDEKNGFLVDEKNVDAFVYRIQWVLNHPNASDLRKKIQSYSLEHCTWKKRVLEVQKVFDRCLGEVL